MSTTADAIAADAATADAAAAEALGAVAAPAGRARGRGSPKPRPSADAVIAGIASRQHGVVARRQLLAADVAAHVIDHRLQTSRLEATYRGVYQVGPVRAPLAPYMAAVLACGAGAVLSHESAARLTGILRRDGEPERLVDVTIVGGRRAPGPAVRVHRVTRLSSGEIATIEGIPVTLPARTLLDLAATLAPHDLERAVARAVRDGRTDTDELVRLMGRYPRRAGTGVLREVLELAGGPAFTRSKAEEIFLVLIRRSGLPPPRANVKVAGIEVDFHWPARRLVVEIDGFEFHRSRAAFERDRERDGKLAAAGQRVRRFTWKQLTRNPERVLVAVARALFEPGS